MKLLEAIGIRIKKLIEEAKLTQYELAKQAGIPRSTVWKIINQDTTKVKTVKIDTVYQITATLGISLKDFCSCKTRIPRIVCKNAIGTWSIIPTV